MSTQPQIQIDWLPYFNKVRQMGSSATLDSVLNAMSTNSYPFKTQNALDVGCGEGRDTMELLRKGWKVEAIDSDAHACNTLLNTAASENLDAWLTVQQSTYDAATYPIGQFDLVNAYLALPYCEPKHFAKVWAHVVDSLKIDGYIGCNLFGDQH